MSQKKNNQTTNKGELDNFDKIIIDFFNRFQKSQKPITISFRKLVKNLSGIERATHFLHPYPAKLLPHIPYFFINNNIFSKPNDTIFDPFCGSGTVLLEAILGNRSAVGIDLNPLAALISQIKTTNFNLDTLYKHKNNIKVELAKNKDLKLFHPKQINTEFWFLPKTIEKLGRLKYEIEQIKSKKYRNFYYLCFSSCLRKVSLADPRVSVPVKLKKDQYPVKHPFRKISNNHLESLFDINVFETFFDIVKDNLKEYEGFKTNITDNDYFANVINSDIKILDDASWSKVYNIKRKKADLIITSPPYAGAQKYIRASSLSLGWLENLLGAKIREYDNNIIGRENYKKNDYQQNLDTGIEEANKKLRLIHKKNPLRAYIASNYLNEMEIALKNSLNYLKEKGYLILIVGNNTICSYKFETQKYITELLLNMNLELKLKLIDEIKSYGLMTKRNKTANIISREWVLIFQKK